MASATVLNGRSQQPHQLDELLLGLGSVPDDFFEPLELIQTAARVPVRASVRGLRANPARLPATSPATVLFWLVV